MDTLAELIQQIIDKIPTTLSVSSIDGNGRIFISDTSYLTIFKLVKDSSAREYKVKEIEINGWIEVEAVGHNFPFSGTTVEMREPTYIHGSPISANVEYAGLESRTLKKTPFIWLLESYEVDDYKDDSIFESGFKTRLFCLDWTGEDDFKSSDNDKYVVKPMNALATKFIEAIGLIPKIRDPKKVGRRVRPVFGVEVIEQGETKKIIDEDLGGVELRFKLETYNIKCCDCETN